MNPETREPPKKKTKQTEEEEVEINQLVRATSLDKKRSKTTAPLRNKRKRQRGRKKGLGDMEKEARVMYMGWGRRLDKRQRH